MQVKITPSPLAGTVQLPPSKSFAIRALICSALAGGGSVAPLGTSADIAATVQALADLAAGRDEIFCNESGSLVRFLIPVAAALGKSVTFTGAGRLPRRPLDAFATLLPQHGVQVQTDGGLPFSVTGKLRPGQYEIAGNVSSQYLTGLLLALPLLDGDSAVLLTTELESKPYIDITLQVMAAFGVQVRPTDFGYLVRGNQQYKPVDFTVESDWSHAAFFMAAGKKYDGYIDSICLNKIEIGRVDGKDINNEFINSIFKETKIKVTIENKMNDYLKTHACAVLPLVFASYKVNGNLKLLKKDKEYSLLIMDAIIEGYDVLKKLGYEILPKGEYENCVNKKKFCAFIYRFMFSNFIGKMCISDHAMSARDEFLLLNSEFEKLRKKSKLETKVYDQLKLELLNYKD
mgnify:CR=1 FL=1